MTRPGAGAGTGMFRQSAGLQSPALRHRLRTFLNILGWRPKDGGWSYFGGKNLSFLYLYALSRDLYKMKNTILGLRKISGSIQTDSSKKLTSIFCVQIFPQCCHFGVNLRLVVIISFVLPLECEGSPDSA